MALRVLFIGNSYTHYNDMPILFQQLAKSAGYAMPSVRMLTKGGRKIAMHLKDPECERVVAAGWDVVVIQGQSEETALKDTSHFLKAARALCEYIRDKNPQTMIVFFETWARHPAFWAEGEGEDCKLGRDSAEMQDRIRKSYGEAALQSQALVAPVGSAWECHYQQAQEISLHRSDCSHPEFAGSYLAALVILGVIYGTEVPQLDFRGSLSKSQADHLRLLAAGVLRPVQRRL